MLWVVFTGFENRGVDVFIWAALALVFSSSVMLGILGAIKQRALFKTKTFAWYKTEHANHVTKNGVSCNGVSCFSCGSARIHVRALIHFPRRANPVASGPG